MCVRRNSFLPNGVWFDATLCKIPLPIWKSLISNIRTKMTDLDVNSDYETYGDTTYQLVSRPGGTYVRPIPMNMFVDDTGQELKTVYHNLFVNSNMSDDEISNQLLYAIRKDLRDIHDGINEIHDYNDWPTLVEVV